MSSTRPHKVYLGDGVYADVAHGHVMLTTENGIRVTNTIYLGPRECESLVKFINNLTTQHDETQNRSTSEQP